MLPVSLAPLSYKTNETSATFHQKQKKETKKIKTKSFKYNIYCTFEILPVNLKKNETKF